MNVVFLFVLWTEVLGTFRGQNLIRSSRYPLLWPVGSLVQWNRWRLQGTPGSTETVRVWDAFLLLSRMWCHHKAALPTTEICFLIDFQNIISQWLKYECVRILTTITLLVYFFRLHIGEDHLLEQMHWNSVHLLKANNVECDCRWFLPTSKRKLISSHRKIS